MLFNDFHINCLILLFLVRNKDTFLILKTHSINSKDMELKTNINLRKGFILLCLVLISRRFKWIAFSQMKLWLSSE